MSSRLLLFFFFLFNIQVHGGFCDGQLSRSDRVYGKIPRVVKPVHLEVSTRKLNIVVWSWRKSWLETDLRVTSI